MIWIEGRQHDLIQIKNGNEPGATGIFGRARSISTSAEANSRKCRNVALLSRPRRPIRSRPAGDGQSPRSVVAASHGGSHCRGAPLPTVPPVCGAAFLETPSLNPRSRPVNTATLSIGIIRSASKRTRSFWSGLRLL